MENFGEKLRTLRKSAGLTLEELGARVGMKKCNVSKYEIGRIKHPSVEVVEKFAAALGVTAEALLSNGSCEPEDQAVLRNFGIRVYAARKELGMTQEELAAKTGYADGSSIGRLENGEIDPPLTRIRKFSKALGVPIPELIGD